MSRDALYACAKQLEEKAEEIVEVLGTETGLLGGRLRAELERTTGQLRLLGDRGAAGWRRESPGIVTVPVPVGPVAVFAASNFPLAFGVLGGDTASAIAAGCPVIVKAHPAQPARVSCSPRSARRRCRISRSSTAARTPRCRWYAIRASKRSASPDRWPAAGR